MPQLDAVAKLMSLVESSETRMTIDSPRIISRDEARALGLKRFFTGKPCKHGHVAERHVASRKCRECHRERTRRYRAADPERARERERRWRAANLELARKGDRERKRLHFAKNKDRILSERAVKRAANPEKAREYQRRWWAANKGKIKAAQREAARAAPPRPHQPPTESVP